MLSLRAAYPLDVPKHLLGHLALPKPRDINPLSPSQKGEAPDLLQAWEECRTGFPWIDAIMAQLHQWGWMHHLARHCVVCDLARTLLSCTVKVQPLPKGAWLLIP